MPAARCRADSADRLKLWRAGGVRGPDVEQEGEIDPIVVIVSQRKSPLIAAYRFVEGSRVFRLIPESLVHRSPQAKRLGVVGSCGVQL